MSAEILREIAKRLRGRRVYGGCDECRAYQTLEEDREIPGLLSPDRESRRLVPAPGANRGELIMNWTCDGCGRAPADVDELLHWPFQSEGGTLCPNCDQEPEPVNVEPAGPQWGGFDLPHLPIGF